MSEICCPKCGSTQYTAQKKGFSGGKAAAGAVLVGGAGLLAGTIGSDKVLITCLKCGFSYEAGKYDNAKRRIDQKNNTKTVDNGSLPFLLFFMVILVSSVLIPLCGGSWWFLLIMPVVGFSVLLLKETIVDRQKRAKGNTKVSSNRAVDAEIRNYLKSGFYLPAIDYCRSATGATYEEAKNYVDLIASRLQPSKKFPMPPTIV